MEKSEETPSAIVARTREVEIPSKHWALSFTESQPSVMICGRLGRFRNSILRGPVCESKFRTIEVEIKTTLKRGRKGDQNGERGTLDTERVFLGRGTARVATALLIDLTKGRKVRSVHVHPVRTGHHCTAGT